MEAREALERAHEADRAAQHGRLPEKLGALSVAVLAALLALASVFGRRSVAELLLAQEQAIGAATIAETNAIKERVDETALINLRVFATDPETADAAREATADLERHIAETYRPEEERRIEEARRLDEKRDVAERRYESFEYSETAAQMAIVLTTIAIVTGSLRLLWIGGALGLVTLILLIDGFTTFLPI